jgi:TonB family protein
MLGLSQRQVELLIAHELAHIVRYDYVVNYFLLAVETLYFYHPVVYLLGRGIREERELCCDDLVISRCGGRYEYVTALTDIATLRSRHLLDQPLSNLAATGGDLLLRVRRIVKGTAPRSNAQFFVTIVTAVVVLMGGALVFNSNARSPADRPSQAAATVPSRIVTPMRIAPIETRVSAPSLVPPRGSVVDVRAVALIGTPPVMPSPERAAPVTAPQISAAVRASLRRPPSLAGSPRAVPGIERNAMVATAYRPQRAGPTHAMISELDLESPVLESLYDLRRQAGRALAVGKSPYTAVDGSSGESDYVVTELAAFALRERGGALIKRIEPRYPSRARLRGYTDTVQIEFLVTDTGEVDEIVVVSANSKPAFERSVVQAVRKWRYEPLLRDGVPVQRRLVETFAFRLNAPGTSVQGRGCFLDKNHRFTCVTPGVSRVL